MNKHVAVSCTHDSLKAKAEQLAQQLKLPLVTNIDNHFDFLLVYTSEHLQLQQNTKETTGPIYVDFIGGKANHRRLYGGGRKQLIARACGIKPRETLTIIDATAGLGRDAFVLACLGCDVTMLERSGIIAALLQDGLDRLQANNTLSSNLSLIQTDACDYLKTLKQKPDVIYLDPMFPARTKTALVKKEMRLFQALLAEENNAVELLNAALGKAEKRVVVKRPRLAPQLTELKPSIVYSGKSSRFDVYL